MGTICGGIMGSKCRKEIRGRPPLTHGTWHVMSTSFLQLPRSVQWQQRFAELQEWYAAHGTLPKASDGPQARSLSNWLAKAKQRYKHGKLSRLLRMIPLV